MAPKFHRILVAPRSGQALPPRLGLLGQRHGKTKEAAQRFPPFRQRDILGSLSAEDRALFLDKCVRKRFKKSETLYAAGDSHRATFLIESGLVRTYHQSAVGKEITLGYWSSGDIIGGPYFFDDTGIHFWSARAVADSTVLLITGHELRTLVTTVPMIGKAVLDAISFKLLWDSLLLQILGTRSVPSRLAHLLIKLTVVHGVATHDQEITVNHYFTQEDFASMVGATRQWVNTQFRRFQRDGILQIRNRQITIRDLNRLEKLCEW